MQAADPRDLARAGCGQKIDRQQQHKDKNTRNNRTHPISPRDNASNAYGQFKKAKLPACGRFIRELVAREQCRVTQKRGFCEKTCKSGYLATKNTGGIPDPVAAPMNTIRIERVLSGHRLPVAHTLPPCMNAPQAGRDQRFVRPTLGAYLDWWLAPDLLPYLLKSRLPLLVTLAAQKSLPLTMV